jgi:hypothetical protein
MLPTSIIEMNEEYTGQNPQNYHLIFKNGENLILFRAFKFMVMGECTPKHQQILKHFSKTACLIPLFQ